MSIDRKHPTRSRIAAGIAPIALVFLGETMLAHRARPALAHTPWRGYDQAADARADLARATRAAAQSEKKVLAVFGANWCGDCRVLDLAMKEGALKAKIERDFFVVKVDVGRFDRNTDVAAGYGVPLNKGIPTIAVLDAKGQPVFVTTGGQPADARALGEAGLLRFFDRVW